MDGYTLNAARTIREYESSIQRPKAERTINDSILSALLRGDELPEMDVKAIRQYGIQCSEYLDFGYDVDASLSGMLSPHAPAQHTVCIQESRIRQPALHLYAKTSQECNRPKRGRQPSTWAYHRADQIASGKARRAGSRFRPAELYGKR